MQAAEIDRMSLGATVRRLPLQQLPVELPQQLMPPQMLPPQMLPPSPVDDGQTSCHPSSAEGVLGENSRSHPPSFHSFCQQ
jgi:hypothetical protein